ncbi:MAG: C-GCAxxG-C-C family protein [Chloroflexota bacterium]|nr:C-GCAxxG-C-C family protein [Chloroflexota bacterium]
MTREEVEKRAFDNYQSGFHCAESISKAVVELYAEGPSNEIPRIAAGFLGGIGATHEEVCGALAGGIIAIGYLFGRMEPGKDIQDARELAAEFRHRFVEEFGATNCQVLLDGFGNQENAIKCKRLTATAAGLLSELLEKVGPARDGGNVL